MEDNYSIGLLFKSDTLYQAGNEVFRGGGGNERGGGVARRQHDP